MDLLPKTRREFSSSTYWETFFKKRGTRAFEWYGEYSTFCAVLAKYIKPTDKILVSGCGNSDMSSQMFDFGYKNITNIDISANVINQMSQKNTKSRPDLKFLEMDLFNTSFSDNEFSVILDKGTLDAIYSEDSEENRLKVDTMFKEVTRLLRLGGRYVCISLAQQFIAEKIIDYFSNEGWLTRVCLVQNNDDDVDGDNNENKSLNMPIFLFILTKFKKIPNSKPIFEACFLEEKIERFDSPSDLLATITDLQNYALVRHNLKSGKPVEDQICVTLYSPSLPSSPRYTIYVVDGNGKKKFAVFIVPQGRELEWMFSTNEGRKQLHKSCNFERLLIVLLSRFHDYSSLDLVKAELSSKVLQLAPPNIDKQSPFLTIGESISVRSKLYEGCSEISGQFSVEDIQIDNKLYRRLVFYCRPDIVQSEVLLKKVLKRAKKKHQKAIESYEVDHSYLSCTYYSPIIAGLFLAEDFKDKLDHGMKVALVGLGGGCLPMYMHRTLVNAKIKAVEIDKSVWEVAEKWFDLKTDDGRIDVVIQDGLCFIEEAAEKDEKYDMLVIDVDNKDHTLAFSSPPASFIEDKFIECCSRVLSEGGVYVLNLTTRSQDNREMVVKRLKSYFSSVYGHRTDEDVNEIIYGLPTRINSSLNIEQNGEFTKHIQENLDEFINRIKSIDVQYCKPLEQVKLTNLRKA